MSIHFYTLSIFCFLTITQLTGLEPVCNLLSQTQPQHSVLSRSLDATRHELPVKETIIPSEGLLRNSL